MSFVEFPFAMQSPDIMNSQKLNCFFHCIYQSFLSLQGFYTFQQFVGILVMLFFNLELFFKKGVISKRRLFKKRREFPESSIHIILQNQYLFTNGIPFFFYFIKCLTVFIKITKICSLAFLSNLFYLLSLILFSLE